MKIYKIWNVKDVIYIRESDCVEKKRTYLVNDDWYVKKEEIDKLNDNWDYMYSLKCDEETIALFRKQLKEKYDAELRRVQEKITNLENATVVKYK